MPTSLDFSGLTFAVDSVVAGTEPFPTTDLVESLEMRGDCRILQISVPELLVKNRRYRNGLIDAVSVAYAQHLPLVLSPDAIWLTIAQGFASHIRQNAEEFRARLVRHSGKKQLTAIGASWAEAIADYATQIEAETDAAVSDALVCSFSTTTAESRIASQVVLMDTYSEYFNFRSRFICGIPRVTLQGTPDDWSRMRERVEVFATFGLEGWVNRLRPILDEFVRTAEGVDSRSFWSSIYSAEPIFGGACQPPTKQTGERITGWIADLFPYLGIAPRLTKNPALEGPRESWTQPGGGVQPKEFPSSLSEVPVKARVNGTDEDVTLLAGLFGVCQNRTDLAVAPLIGWAAAQPVA